MTAAAETVPTETRRVLLALGQENPDQAAGDVAKITLERRIDGGAHEWTETYDDPSSFAVEAVARAFGGGQYRANLLRADGTFIARPSFRVAGEPIRRAPSASAVAPSSELEQLRAELSRLRAQLEGGGGRGGSPILEVMQVMIPLMTAMMTAQGAAMKPVLEALAQKDRPAVDPLGMCMQLLDLLDKRGGDGGSGDGYGKVIEQVGIPLLGRLTEMAKQEQAPAAAPAAPLAPGAPAPQQNPPTLMELLGEAVPDLVNMAELGAGPQLVAHRVVAAADEPQLEVIEQLLDLEAAGRDEFFRSFPATVIHRTWFEKFFTALEQELPEEPDEPPAAANAGAGAQ